MQETNNRRVFIISVAIAIVIVGIVVLITQSIPSRGPSTPVGNANATEDLPAASGSSFVGYDSLYDLGVTVDQIEALQTAFQKYKSTGATNTEIDMSGGTPVQYMPDPHDPLYRFSIDTSVVVNKKTTYKIKFYYWSTSSIQLLIYDNTGKTKLFDSGTVTSAT